MVTYAVMVLPHTWSLLRIPHNQWIGGEKRSIHLGFLYMERAPDEVFYDFACSLQEYCLNREPDFWKNTRFWHDVFHGFSHKCGNAFRSQRIRSLRYVNSEICEQFNAFLQCIKYTGTHLTQSHFCFFVQFFITMWQRKKTEAFTKKLMLARAGLSA